ncbi:MAG: hypothetical protein JXA33_15295 [Anaerolineae bacterium]|nr:hypothetical protein [Anaerolineae bacterium]
MKKLFQNLTMRHPTTGDAQATLDLMIACDIAQYGEPDSSLDDLLYDWTLIDLAQDAWLIFAPDNQLIGYAAVYENETTFSFDFYTHPVYDNAELQGYLLAECESRAYVQMMEAQRAEADATTIISQTNVIGRQVIEASGFKPRFSTVH